MNDLVQLGDTSQWFDLHNLHVPADGRQVIDKMMHQLLYSLKLA
jgi:hypothetical protein